MSEKAGKGDSIPYTLRIGWFEIGFCTILFGGFFWGVISDYLKYAQKFDLAAFAFLIYCCLCVAKIRLRLTEEGILYYYSFNLFATPVKISWHSMRKVETGVEQRGASSWRYFTRIHESEDKKPLEINIKWFNKKGLTFFAKTIMKLAPDANLDEGTVNLTKGIFPSFLQEKE